MHRAATSLVLSGFWFFGHLVRRLFRSREPAFAAPKDTALSSVSGWNLNQLASSLQGSPATTRAGVAPNSIMDRKISRACILVCPGGYIPQIAIDPGSRNLVPKNIEFDLTRNRIRLGLGMFIAERRAHEAHWNRHLPASQVGLWHRGTRAGMAIEGIVRGSIARSGYAVRLGGA